MRNPYLKYLRPEDHLHHQVLEWMKYQHPNLKYHHSPNEGKRSKFEQFLYTYLGSDSGFPDIQIPALHLVIELKVKPNRCSPAQKEWLEYFKGIGWRAEVCFTYDEAVRVINESAKCL